MSLNPRELAVTGCTMEGKIDELREAGFAEALHKRPDALTLPRAERKTLDVG
jgi:hypothetical protein